MRQHVIHDSGVDGTDLFCGAGGSSEGAVQAGLRIRVAANHWPRAIETHSLNHPTTRHEICDLAATDPWQLPRTTLLIASPECTNHSQAKGKKRARYAENLFGERLVDPAEARSRATAWQVVRYTEYHRYEMVIVENVTEFRHWDEYDAWIAAMRNLGYEHRAVYLNSMFAPPTPQSRDRIYVVFWRAGNRAPDLDFRPVAPCPRCGATVGGVQTFKDQRKAWGRYGRNGQYIYTCPDCRDEVFPFYVPALCAIDWSLPSEKIGDRRAPLQPKTLERIRRGLERFGGRPLPEALVGANRTHGVPRDAAEAPVRTVATGGHLFVVKLRGDNIGHALDDALSTVSAGGRHHALVGTPFLTRHYSVNCDPAYLSKAADDAPLGVVTTQDHHSLTTPPGFLAAYYGTDAGHALDGPVPTVPTLARHALVAYPDAPPPAYPGAVIPFLVSAYGDRPGYARNPTRPVDRELPTITGGRTHRLAVPSAIPSVEECGFRMLEPHELKHAMAFPADYEITGNKGDQIKQAGNSVTPPVMRLLVERCLATLD